MSKSFPHRNITSRRVWPLALAFAAALQLSDVATVQAAGDGIEAAQAGNLNFSPVSSLSETQKTRVAGSGETAGKDHISDERLDAYITAGFNVRQAVMDSAHRWSYGFQPTRGGRLRQDVYEAISVTPGIDVDEYFAIGHAVHESELLRHRVRQRIAEMRRTGRLPELSGMGRPSIGR